jgi:hypothetical protein
MSEHSSSAGLFPAGMIHRLGHAELARAARHRRDLALILVDLPNGYTSAPWRPAVAALLDGAMRESDLIGWLDHRRLVVLLPETSAEGAAVVLRRLGIPIDEHDVVRAGWAVCPGDASTWAGMLDVASARLEALDARRSPVSRPTTCADEAAAATR